MGVCGVRLDRGDMTGDGVRVPKYFRLKEDLRRQIADLEPGSPIDPERVLSDRYGVSRTTVRQALHELTVEGRLVRRQGRGTFVAKPKMAQELRLTSYSEDITAQGRRPTSRLLANSYVPATTEVAAHLGVPVGAPVLRMERLRLADGEPMAVEAVHLDGGRFPSLQSELGDDVSLYRLLYERHQVELVEAVETIETAMASPAEARLLQTDTGSPLLLLTRASWDRTGRPVEFVNSLYRGDRYRLVARLQRP